jgi:hypothetical protein
MSNKTLFTKYLKNLYEVAAQGDAREESFYPALAEMLRDVAQSGGRTDVHVTTLPRQTDAGNPDFRIWNGSDRIIGYVEAKKPTEERLDVIENSEQLRRYRDTFPNLILTNFLEFRLYRNGQLVDTVLAARPMALNMLKTLPPLEKPEQLAALLDRFLEFSLPKAFTAESLAFELAKRTRFLRDVVARELQQEQESSGELSGFFEAFRTYLIGTLTEEDFADLFAQTITYGLFAARTRAGDGFNRRSAFDNIPHTIGVLRDLFRFISLGDPSDELAWCVDDIAEVLAVADAPGILDRYYHEGKGSDPIVHFYETFLAQYDPAERERRGVYYTPEPVVFYIVRSLHDLLKTEFKKADGLASEGVTLLDPAAGTMTFVARAAQEAVSQFESKYGKGAREEFIRRHVLKNFYAFELMMAPYAVGHLKMGFFLEELGHRLKDDERVAFYLTNTLDTEELEQSRLPGFSALAEESRLAGKVKKQTPILVILGNPPYSGESSNQGEWIRGLIADYKQVDGKPLGERNSKWLQDDYVKFLRFAQWKIEQAGCGVVGMITNHSYLDNPTFRGMRQSLMQTYDDIYILDLHGNSLKKETRPDGSKDENVFDIRQGVAIAFFIKRGGKRKAEAVVRHADIWGTRESKYEWLHSHDLKRTKWRTLKPAAPFYLFVEQDEAGAKRYKDFIKITEVFPLNGVGMTTARDKFVIDRQKSSLINRVRLFKQNKGSDNELHLIFNISRKKGWSIRKAWNMLQALSDRELEEQIVPVFYRPFDVRWIFYHDSIVWRTVKRVMRHMLAGENVALITCRQLAGLPWGHALVSNAITDNCLVSNGTKERGYHFPLYLYPEKADARKKRMEKLAGVAKALMLFEPAAKYTTRVPNLSPLLVEALEKAFKKEAAPEEIFHYIYAVLYAPAYREKYAQFLKMDFPRIPFTADFALFKKIGKLGERLCALHLLKSKELDPPSCRFDGEGDNSVAKGRNAGLRYDLKGQRLYINATQYFAPVPEDVWKYHVGGYQVCEKWLKDRKERSLGVDEIRTYCRIVAALKLTIAIQQEINALYPLVEEKTITTE